MLAHIYGKIKDLWHSLDMIKDACAVFKKTITFIGLTALLTEKNPDLSGRNCRQHVKCTFINPYSS